MARRGDRIRCTVIFDNERKSDGKVQVVFFLNDKKIMMRDGEDHIFMDYDQPLYPYIGLTHGCSVLAKVIVKKYINKEFGFVCLLVCLFGFV